MYNTSVINESNFPALKRKLKPITCPRCMAEGCPRVGNCEKCLKNQAYNVEWLMTHSFITDTECQNYHDDDHDAIKGLKLRLPNERPLLYYGIELEIGFGYGSLDLSDGYYDEDDEWHSNTEKLDEILAKFSEITDGLFIYETDSTVENGVEFISRPCSYAYWTHKDTVKKLKDGLEYLRDEGALITQPTGHGFHIHLSTAFFENTAEEGKHTGTEALRSFDWLFQKFQPELEILGRREYTEYSRSKADKLKNSFRQPSFSSMYKVDVEYTAKLKRGGAVASGDHSNAVIMSGPTIEARIFKSTTDYETVLATIEIVRAFAHAVRDNQFHCSLDEILHSKDTLFLDGYIQKRRLAAKKAGQKLDLTKVNDDEIIIETTATNN